MTAAALREKLQDLYFGEHDGARRFRYGLVTFDLATIIVFIVSSFASEERWMIILDLVMASLLSVEFAARIYAEPAKRALLLSFTTLADIVVILSLLLAAFAENLAFLRIVRALRLLRSYHLLRDLRSQSPWFRLHEDIIQRTVNLGVFIFIVTSVVYVTQHAFNPKIASYVDALYFTITTLTTTGFGDITLEGTGGRLLAVAIMFVGVGLFLRLLQAIFRPRRYASNAQTAVCSFTTRTPFIASTAGESCIFRTKALSKADPLALKWRPQDSGDAARGTKSR